MKDFFKSKNNIIVFSVIIMFLAVIAAISFSYSSKSKEYEKTLSQKDTVISSMTKTAEDYRSSVEEKNKEIENYKNEKQKMQSQISSITKENESLKKQITELAAKKKAAASATQTVKKDTPKTNSYKNTQKTDEIIKKLTLPPEKQASQLPNVCYLTFDDGPSKNTPKILSTLKKYNVKATFFVIGTGKLDMLPQMVAEGHAIGLHSNTHEYSYIYSSTEKYLTDLKAISDKVQNKIGKKVQIVRFPGGSNNLVSKKYCVGIMTRLSKLVPQMGYNYIDWNVCAGDADKPLASVSEIVSNTLNRVKGKNSICVLLHDAPAKTTTPAALPGIIEGLAKMGFRFEVITPNTNGYHFKVAN